MTKNIIVILVVIFIAFIAWLLISKNKKIREEVYISPAPTASSSPEVTIQPTGSPVINNPNGLKTQDLVLGSGIQAKKGDVLTVHYVGTLENGTKFDSSLDRGQPFSFKVGNGDVIAGWDLGLLGMKIGGKRKLIIPPSLGYGDRAVGNMIPANSTLIFEVELLAVSD